MPIYEYQCDDCGKQFEELKRGFDNADAVCPDCAAHARRLISHSSFVLKGSGWYVTDYKKSDNGGGAADAAAKQPTSTSDNGDKKPSAAADN